MQTTYRVKNQAAEQLGREGLTHDWNNLLLTPGLTAEVPVSSAGYMRYRHARCCLASFMRFLEEAWLGPRRSLQLWNGMWRDDGT